MKGTRYLPGSEGTWYLSPSKTGVAKETMHEDANREDSTLRRALALFVTLFAISGTANSGYAVISVVKDEFVNKRKWFTEEEMADFIAIVQSTPGAMAVNISMIVGYQSAGLLGSFAAVLGCILPPLLVMIVVTFFYETIVSNQYVYLFMRGMQLGVVGMLLDVIIGLFNNVIRTERVYPIILIVLAFCYVKFTDFSIFYLAIACAVAGVVKALLVKREAEAA